MMTKKLALFALLVTPAFACSSSTSGTPDDGSGGSVGSGSGGSTSSSGGSTGSGGVTSTGGTSASGGSSATGGTSASGGSTATGGKTASGGTSASGGSTSTSTGGAGEAAGGSHTGGTSGGGGRAAGGSGPGSGGSGSGGSGTGAGGGSGTSTTPKPSAGCSKMTPRPSGGQVSVSNEKLYIFPSSYDGTKPFPLVIALHACGNPNTEFVSQFKGTGFDTEYVQAYPNTPDSGQCWSSYTGDVSRILAQYDELMATYCIDQNRVFAVAHSSGAQMLVNILSHKSDAQHLNLKAVSPVAADPYNVALPTPVLYIDGKNDNQRSANSATDAVAKFRTANMCQSTSKAYSSIMTCKSVQNGAAVDPGCIIYDGCSVPTIWCSHNDPNYSNTEHGIPCFAMKGMYDFFKSLP